MLVELGLVEQRYKAVLEVLDGATVIDWPAATGWCARPYTPGCGPMPLTFEQVAEVFGVTRSTAYELVRSGDIESIRLRRRIVWASLTPLPNSPAARPPRQARGLPRSPSSQVALLDADGLGEAGKAERAV